MGCKKKVKRQQDVTNQIAVEQSKLTDPLNPVKVSSTITLRSSKQIQLPPQPHMRDATSPFGLHTYVYLTHTHARTQNSIEISNFIWCKYMHCHSELRVNYHAVVIPSRLKVEAPQDISMPMCLKANFTLHASGTKPSNNLHFNRISLFTASL